MDRRIQGSNHHSCHVALVDGARSPALLLSIHLCSPVTLARCCTVEVFPVPVSPTRRTGSPLNTHSASCSSSTAEGRVAANVWFSLVTIRKRRVGDHTVSCVRWRHTAGTVMKFFFDCSKTSLKHLIT